MSLRDWKDIHTKAELKRCYLSYLPFLMKLAQRHGYALALHGSCERDLDLIAVPWVPKACAPESLVMSIQEAFTGYASSRGYWKEEAKRGDQKPFGRKAYIIPIAVLAEDFEGVSLGYPQHHAIIDLSITSR